MEKTEKVARARGRAPSGIETVQYTVMLESETAEWAKRQPGGLSDMLRRLLRQAWQEEQPKEPAKTIVSNYAGFGEEKRRR